MEKTALQSSLRYNFKNICYNLVSLWYRLQTTEADTVFFAWLIQQETGSMEELEVTFVYFAGNVLNIYVVSWLVYYV